MNTIKVRFYDNSKYKEDDVLEQLEEYARLQKEQLNIDIEWDYIKVENPKAPPFKAEADNTTSDKDGTPRRYHWFDKLQFRIRFTIPAWKAGARMVMAYWDSNKWHEEYDRDEQDLGGHSIDDFLGVSECGFKGSPHGSSYEIVPDGEKTNSLLGRMLHEGIPGHGFWDHLVEHLRPAGVSQADFDVTHDVHYHHPVGMWELFTQAKPYAQELFADQEDEQEAGDAILPDTKDTIILNAGHWDDPDTPHIEDPGASHLLVREAIEVMKIRDKLVPMLQHNGFTVKAVPDTLDLSDSIAWANDHAPELNDALAVDIHLNYLSDTSARGSEAFYGSSNTSKQIASALSEGVSNEMGIPDRGAKPDTATAVGSLGWIRKTKMWATLIEVCFLTNEDDMDALHGVAGYEKAARGIAKGICRVYGKTYKPLTAPEPEPEPDPVPEPPAGTTEITVKHPDGKVDIYEATKQ